MHELILEHEREEDRFSMVKQKLLVIGGGIMCRNKPENFFGAATEE